MVILGGAFPFLLQLLLPSPVPLMAGPARVAPAQSWWRTSFPPPAVALFAPLPPLRVEPAKRVPGLSCGSLDSAKLLDGGVFLTGWAYDPRTGAPARAVILFDNGQQVSPAIHVFQERPDVAEWGKSRRLAATGWSLWLPPNRVNPGKHVFEAYALLADGRFGQLAETRSVERPGAP
jgi:hypothetical protein